MAKRSMLPDIWRGSSVSPLRDITRLQRNIDRIFEDFMGPSMGMMSPLWEESAELVPPADIEETNAHYLVAMDLPGLCKDDIQLEVRGNQLLVSGERCQEKREGQEGGRRLASERYYGSFQRVFTLPAAVESDKIEANFENGVLQIAIPKGESAQARQISVKEQKGGIFDRLLGKGKDTKVEKAA